MFYLFYLVSLLNESINSSFFYRITQLSAFIIPFNKYREYYVIIQGLNTVNNIT